MTKIVETKEDVRKKLLRPEKKLPKRDNSLHLLSISHEDLVKLGLTSNFGVIVDSVKKALVDYGMGNSISGKIALTPSRDKMFDLWNMGPKERQRYDDEDLDQKLSALNSFNGKYAAIKLVSGSVLNKERGLPRSESIIVLYAADTIRPICLMRGTEISALRTGAYSAIVGEYLMPKEKDNIVAYIGSGKMAETSLLCMDATIADRIKKIKVYSRTRANRERFVREMQSRVGIELSVADSVGEAVEDADYVITATTALEPIVRDHQLKKNVTTLLIGGDEFGAEHIERCYSNGLVFCDDWDLVKHRDVQSLPFFYKANKDRIDESKIRHLWEIITGKFDIRKTNYDCVHVNCVGLPSLDLEIANKMYQKALKKGVGSKIIL